MARLEFAILQYLESKVNGKMIRIALRRDHDQVIDRLKIRLRENMSGEGVWRESSVARALDKAWNDLIQEFKDETIRMV